MTGYLHVLFYQLDCFLNAISGGLENQTISLRCAVADAAGKMWARVACRVLGWLVETDHCPRTLAGEALSKRGGLIAGLILALLFIALTGGFWALLL